MVDAWPGTLPQKPLQNGYSEAAGDGLAEYQPDVGPPLTRRRTAAVVRLLAVSYELTSSQLATLRAFVDTNLLGGALPFTFPAPSESATYLCKFQKSGLPKWSALGGDYYSVSMMLWILP